MSEQYETQEISELHRAIINAVNRGYVWVANIQDYLGPRLQEQSRGMDSAAYLDQIELLVEQGYLKRESKRFNKQLKLELTEKGRDVATELSEEEKELLDEYDVDLDSLSLLETVIEYQKAEGSDSAPSISDLQEFDDRLASSYRYTIQFNRLVDAGLANEKGILRYRIQPTAEGRRVVEAYESVL